MMTYDYIVIGAGFYGLYAARYLGRKGKRVIVLEKDNNAFARASYINQARVHMGYHYPRSITTAVKSRNYFERFSSEFRECVNSEFEQIYAISKNYSWTSAREFRKFCEDAGILCDEVDAEKFFWHGLCEGAFVTREYSYDAKLLKDMLLREIYEIGLVDLAYGTHLTEIVESGDEWIVRCGERAFYQAACIVNCSYAGVNEIHALCGFEPFRIKYEKCEIILCSTNLALRNTGITVMDGPFFSVMPFGKTGLHSLTSVNFTPHETSYYDLPRFTCQELCECRPCDIYNCNECDYKPDTAWGYMKKLVDKYMNDRYKLEYEKSLYVIKPILQTSEVDDSRPTLIRELKRKPRFISVLSGKINTVYDLEDVLGE